MIDEVAHINSKFFLQDINFENGVLALNVGAGDNHQLIIFEYVRGFFFFKESDFFQKIEHYQCEKIISSNEPYSGVFKVSKNLMLDSLYGNTLEDEEPGSFWVATPDECLEVIAFSNPYIKPKSSRSVS